MGHRKIRGIALISTFLFVGLLFMMAAAMVVTSRSRVFAGVSQHHQAQAFYLAESGLVRSMVALENDLDWPGVTDATIEGMPGTYTVTFGNDKYGSVNNIGIATTADGYRGPDSVPRNSAVLVVQANVSGQQYVLEALVDGRGSVGYMSDAILAAGRVRTHGDLHIDGISGLEDNTPVDGSIQSNLAESSDLVTWDGNGTALITGQVGISGSSASAIDMPGADIQGGPELNTVHNVPSYDVEAEVDGNSGHAAPSIDDGGTLTGGKYSTSGDQTVNGDLILEDGAEIYIGGDLTVTGSIKGNGTVWVKGNTTFRGDSSVTTNDDFSVSLYSEGNVKLTGFDGTEFLANIDDETRHLLRYTEHAVSEAQSIVEASGTTIPPPPADWNNPGDNMLNRLHELNSGMGIHVDGNGDVTDYWEEEDELITNAMGQLHDKLTDLPDGETKAFLQQRLDNLKRVFTSADDFDGAPSGYDLEQVVIDNFDATGETAGFIDAVLDNQDQAHWNAAANMIRSVSYDKPGAAYFQGAIYTKGFFYADNEINVLGAIMVDGSVGTGEETFTRRVFDPATMRLVDDPTPITLGSGDVYLGQRTRVTYVEEFFTDDSSDSSGPQNLATMHWMGR